MSVFKRYWHYLILTLLPFVTYVSTRPPHVGFMDAGLMAASVRSLGIPQTPGFPVYLLVAHLFTRIPFLSAVDGLYLFSHLTAIGILIAVFLLVKRLTKDQYAGILASLSLAFSYSFWSDSINIDAFSITNLTIVLLLLFALWFSEKLKKRKIPKRAVILASILAGLGFGMYPTILVLVPASTIWAFFNWRSIKQNLTVFIAALIIIATIGIAVYAYVPIRARAEPFLNFGRAQDLHSVMSVVTGFNFVTGHIERQGDKVSVIGFHWIPQIMWDSFLYYWKMFLYQFHLFIPLILLGWLRTRVKNRQFFYILTSIFLVDMFFTVIYLSGDREGWMVTSWIIMAIFLGVGFTELKKMYLQKLQDKNISLLALGIAFVPLLWWYPKLDRSQDSYGQDYINNLYLEVPKNAVVIGNANLFEAQTAYAREVRKYRTDIIPIAGNWLYDGKWYRDHVSSAFEMNFSKEAESVLSKIENRRHLTTFIGQFIKDNPDKQFFLTNLFFSSDMQDIAAKCIMGINCMIDGYKLIPHGLLLKVVPKGSSEEGKNLISKFKFRGLDREAFYLEPIQKQQFEALKYEYILAEQIWQEYIRYRGWREYSLGGYSFLYPPNWDMVKTKEGLVLKKDDFTVEITQGESGRRFGKLIKQGLAKVPNVKQAIVRFWQDKKQQRLQFILLDSGKKVEVVVGPTESKLMSVFDRILGSFNIP